MSRHAEFTSTSNKRKVISTGGGETDVMEKSKKTMDVTEISPRALLGRNDMASPTWLFLGFRMDTMVCVFYQFVFIEQPIVMAILGMGYDSTDS